MKAFGKYISKYLLSFFAFALVLLFVNILSFALTFSGIVSKEYGSASPANMLEAVAADLSASGISKEREQELNHRLISRAINNLVQNSIRHNPQGCAITLRLACSDSTVVLTVSDNGVGLSAEKLRELEEKPHYMESTDERLDLRHGLGMLLVRQIVEAHGGVIEINTTQICGVAVILSFQKSSQ